MKHHVDDKPCAKLKLAAVNTVGCCYIYSNDVSVNQ